LKITTIGWWGAYPGKNEAASGYLLQTDNKNILIDCGSGVLSKLQNYIDIEDLDEVVLSHYHADHISDVYCLQYAVKVLIDIEKRENPLDIYGHEEDDKFSSLTYEEYTTGKPYDEETELEFDNLKITFKKTIHKDTCYSIKVEENGKTFVFSADTGWNDELIEFAKDSDLFICETSLYNKFYGRVEGHLTAGEVGKIAEEARVKQLVLSHLPHYGDHKDLVDEVKENYSGKVELAETGKYWEL